jgi:hypothetical protein
VNTLRYAQDLRPGAEKLKKAAREIMMKSAEAKRLTLMKSAAVTKSGAAKTIAVVTPTKAKSKSLDFTNRITCHGHVSSLSVLPFSFLFFLFFKGGGPWKVARVQVPRPRKNKTLHPRKY